MRKRKFSVAVFLCAALLPAIAQAANLKVNCSHRSEDTLPTVTAALARLSPTGPNTVTVSGACHENVTIQSLDRLTLIASSGASITDASGGTADVVLINDSQRITMQGFTVNGGSPGVRCVSHSLCRFSGNTIQNSAGDGVVVSRSHAEFNGDIIQNNSTGRGLVVVQAGEALTLQVTIRGNGADGSAAVRVADGSFLFAALTTVQSNGGTGIRLTDRSTMRSEDSTITGNGGAGVSLEGGSEGRFLVDVTGNVITGNGGHGVRIADLSFANFESPGNNISGNTTQPDVICTPQFSAERGALPSSNIGGGTTNCVEP